MDRIVNFFLLIISAVLFSYLGAVLIPLAAPHYPNYAHRLLTKEFFPRRKALRVLAAVIMLALSICISAVVWTALAFLAQAGALPGIVGGLLLGGVIAFSGVQKYDLDRKLIGGVNLLKHLRHAPASAWGKQRVLWWAALVGGLAVLSLLSNLLILVVIYLASLVLFGLVLHLDSLLGALTTVSLLIGVEAFFVPSYFALVADSQVRLKASLQEERLYNLPV